MLQKPLLTRGLCTVMSSSSWLSSEIKIRNAVYHHHRPRFELEELMLDCYEDRLSHRDAFERVTWRRRSSSRNWYWEGPAGDT